VVIGTVAVIAYVEPVQTGELAIVILAGSDEEYLEVLRNLSELAEGRDGMHLIYNNIPVQMFPTTVSPLYHEALELARVVRVGNLRAKVASPEYLIVMALVVFQDTDRLRIGRLVPEASQPELYELIERFDDDQSTLARRLQAYL
jgi:hypothetical protein